jgi:hypothetical protein
MVGDRFGEVLIFTDVDPVQPEELVTVTVYIPGAATVIVSVNGPFDQTYDE